MTGFTGSYNPNTGQQAVSAPGYDASSPQVDPWKLRELQVNPDPYQMLPEIVYRAYNQQRKLYQDAGLHQAAAPAPAPRAQADALQQGPMDSEKYQQTPTYVRLVQPVGGQAPYYMSAQPWEPGAVQSGSTPHGYAPPPVPKEAYGGKPGGGDEHRPAEATTPQGQTGDEAIAAYWKRVQAAQQAYDSEPKIGAPQAVAPQGRG